MAAINVRDYETLYGVGLLDDLHNYFPAVLYEPEQFRSVSQLLTYITRQTHRRFDLFTFGQTAYNERVRPQPTTNAIPRVVVAAAPPRVPVTVNSVSTSTVATAGTYQTLARPATQLPPILNPLEGLNPLHDDEETEDEEENEIPELNRVAAALLADGRVSIPNQGNTLTLLSALLGLRYPPQQPAFPAEFLNPVVVRPTEAQINQATTLTTLEANSTENCAICQDSITAQSEQREINHCHHAFHKGCIDTWFQENVHCPVCRHDIRETTQ
jgi:hypothetical protein